MNNIKGINTKSSKVSTIFCVISELLNKQAKIDMKKLLILPFSILLLLSCARLPVYQAKQTLPEKDTSVLRYYDAESRVLFDVYQNDDNIYLKLQTSYYYSQVKILKLGLTLWFDQKAKKNEDIGIIFPQENLSSQQAMHFKGANTSISNQLIMTQLHNQYLLSPKTMVLLGMDGKDSKKEMYANLESSDIKVNIEFDSLNRLFYTAMIPKSRIFTNPKYSDNQFSIGVVSGYKEIDFSKMNQGRPSGGGGQGRGGGMGGGHKGGQGRPQAGNMQQRTALTEPIKFWFSVNLN